MKLGCLERSQVRQVTEAFVSSFCSSINRPSYLRSAGNMKPSRVNHSYCAPATRRRRVISSMDHNANLGNQGSGHKEEREQEERQFKYKFDPQSETDAFGRDPRKETEFWMDAAKNVLESDEVQQAIARHAAEGGDGLTDEQREYMEFIKSLDEESK